MILQENSKSHKYNSSKGGADNKMFISQSSPPVQWERNSSHYFTAVQWDKYNLIIYYVCIWYWALKCMISLTVGCMVPILHAHVKNIQPAVLLKTNKQAWTYRRKLFDGNECGFILRLFTLFPSIQVVFCSFLTWRKEDMWGRVKTINLE